MIEKVNTVFELTNSGEYVSNGAKAIATMWKSSIIIEGVVTMEQKRLPAIHPGEILLEEFLKPMGITQYRIAKDISVPARRINEIVHGKRSITANTALRLAQYFGTSPQFWLNLQAHYDLETEKDKIGERLPEEVRALATG